MLQFCSLPGCTTESMLICAPVSAAIFLMVAPAGPENISRYVQISRSLPFSFPAYDLADQMARHNDRLVHLFAQMTVCQEACECVRSRKPLRIQLLNREKLVSNYSNLLDHLEMVRTD